MVETEGEVMMHVSLECWRCFVLGALFGCFVTATPAALDAIRSNRNLKRAKKRVAPNGTQNL